MNIESQKKWFIYVGDHHEGPFTPAEIFQKINEKTNTDENFVWREGMNDWLPLTQVHELNQEIQKLSQKNKTGADEPAKEPRTALHEVPALSKRDKNKTKTQKSLFLFVLLILLLGGIGMGTLSLLSRSSSEEFHASIRPLLHKTLVQLPFLSGLIQSVPTLNDVKPDELIALEQATLGSPEAGVKVAFAISNADPNRPFFYISSNVPTKTKFDFYLIGNSETLLNKLQYSTQTSATLNVGFGHSEVLLAEGGQPIPKGEYQVFVTEAVDQDDSIKNELTNYAPVKASIAVPALVPAGTHFLFTKNYFLGGERDQTYLTRLKAFHEKIKQNADKEMTELKQYSDTLYSQFNTFTSDFDKIYNAKKPTPTQKLNWKKNSETWVQINNQLEQTLQTWTKETLQNEFFYGKVYELVKSSYESMKKLYQLESAYLEKPQDKSAFEIQHGKALSESREANEILKSKVEMILKTPPSASGLPSREGL